MEEKIVAESQFVWKISGLLCWSVARMVVTMVMVIEAFVGGREQLHSELMAAGYGHEEMENRELVRSEETEEEEEEEEKQVVGDAS
ncbi:hypothetical protein CDL15_Pgr018001 [Punica granatum]|nr:hypothetical protein CDL15_Pgr018001 [Punica granatum]